MSTSSSSAAVWWDDLEHDVEADALGDAALGAEGADLDRAGVVAHRDPVERRADVGRRWPAHAAARRRSRSRPWSPGLHQPVIAPPRPRRSRAGARSR